MNYESMKHDKRTKYNKRYNTDKRIIKLSIYDHILKLFTSKYMNILTINFRSTLPATLNGKFRSLHFTQIHNFLHKKAIK